MALASGGDEGGVDFGEVGSLDPTIDGEDVCNNILHSGDALSRELGSCQIQVEFDEEIHMPSGVRKSMSLALRLQDGQEYRWLAEQTPDEEAR